MARRFGIGIVGPGVAARPHALALQALADRMAFPFDWHRGLIADFVDAVTAGHDPQSNGRTALEVHRLIDALLLSSREGRAVDLAGSGARRVPTSPR